MPHIPSNINPHVKSLQKLDTMMETISSRIDDQHGGDDKTPINQGDVRQWNDFKKTLGQERTFIDTVRDAIEKQDGRWIPFQPAILAADGTVSMPTEFRRGVGDMVALYDARPDPVFKEKAELLIKFDTMLLDASASLDASISKLVQLVRREANDDHALSTDEIAQVRIVMDGIQAGVESLDDVVAYRQALAKELANLDPTSQTPKQILDDIVTMVNDRGNDYDYHSGWNPTFVLFHADRLANDEASEFIGALKATKTDDATRKAVLLVLYENAGDSIAPLIIAKNGADNFTAYAKSLGMSLNFDRVADTQKVHPIG